MNDNDENRLNAAEKLETTVVQRADWERNHQLIQDAYIALFAELKRIPTFEETASRCNLSRQTVWRHSCDLKLEDVTSSVRIRTGRVLHGIAAAAEKGDAACAKLFMQLVHGWREAQVVRHEGSVTYISKIADNGQVTIEISEEQRN